MSEDLQNLLNTLRKDGVEKAEAEASRIVSEAQAKAKKLLEEAKSKADDYLEQAKREGALFQERGKQSLEQAARNALIALGADIEKLFQECLREKVGEAFDPETLKNIILKVSDLYFQANVFEGPARIELPEADEKALMAFISHEMREKFKKGVSIRGDARLSKGFRISLRDKDLYHDFSEQAVAEELSRYLRPELQEILQRVVGKGEAKKEK
jgi:V/A-type H+-transporting ATPase subunit E